MADNITNHTGTWLGVGIKAGGFLAAVGAESTTGKIWNLETGNDSDFQLINARVGLGLGGSGGGVIVMAFNCNNLIDLTRTNTNDWGVSLSMGQKWSEIASAVKKAPILFKILKFLGDSKKLAQIGANDLDQLRNLASIYYTASGMATKDANPSFVSIDIPGVGKGLEISASYSFGGRIDIF